MFTFQNIIMQNSNFYSIHNLFLWLLSLEQGSVPHTAKQNIGAAYSDVKEQIFVGTRFWTRAVGISGRNRD
jgi:hypothetical protein